MKNAVYNAPSARVLLHGHVMPGIGLGTWPLTGQECERSVGDAIEIGYRLIDTAERYGNEREVGNAVRSSGISRGELFISSKFNKEWHSVDGVKQAYEASLSRLGLDYLDLFICHWPVPGRGNYRHAWRGLVRLLESGSVRAIGVSNFKRSHIEEIIQDTGVVPDVNQIQLSPDIARVEARAFHNRQGILTQAWSPIGRHSGLRDSPVVKGIAGQLSRSAAQVILRWHVQRGIVPIPNADRRDWLLENLSVFDFSLSPEQMRRMDELDLGEGAARDSDDPNEGH